MTGIKCFNCAQELWSIQLPLNQAKLFKGPQALGVYPPQQHSQLILPAVTKRWPKLLPLAMLLKGPWNILGSPQVFISLDLEGSRQIPPYSVPWNLCFLGGTKDHPATSTCRVALPDSQRTPPGSAWAPSQWQQVTAAAHHHSHPLAWAFCGQTGIEWLSLLKEALQTHRTQHRWDTLGDNILYFLRRH